jgi:hypothetical protein
MAVRLVDSALCAGRPVRVFAGLSLALKGWRRRSWVCETVNSGRVRIAWLRWA